MNILSLFDGISAGQVALNRAGIKYSNYYASEVDKHAISITQYNYPKTIQLGDVKNWKSWKFDSINNPIDLIFAGSPCVDVSSSKQNREGLKGKESSLFYYFVDILNAYNPKYFFFENVTSMRREDRDKISELLGCQPFAINSSVCTALNRPRLYWTNITDKIVIPPKSIFISDILQPDSEIESKYYLSQRAKDRLEIINHRAKSKGLGYKDCIIDSLNNSKFLCLDANYFKGPDGKRSVLLTNDLRNATPLECERLMTFPDNFSKFGLTLDKKVVSIADTNRYRAIGNSWSVDIIVEFLKKIA